MGTIDLNALRAFVAVHETNSFSIAGARLGVPRSTVSRAIAALEEELGVRLFHRTTRQVSTSTAGKALYDEVGPRLGQLETALASLPEREEEPSGTLRVTSTVDLGTTVLAEATARFTARYPNAKVDVRLTNEVVDLVRDGFDFALRLPRKAMRDSTLVARRVGTASIQLYASPAYVARRGAPRAQDDLTSHDVVAYRGVLSSMHASFADRAQIVCDDMFFLREALRNGAGIGMLPAFLATGDLATGALVRILPRWTVHSGGIYLVHPSAKQLPRKATAFRDLLVEMLRAGPLGA